MGKLITYGFGNECCKPNRFVMDIDKDTINRIRELVVDAEKAFLRSSALHECIFDFGYAGQYWYRTRDNDVEIFSDYEDILAIKDDFAFNDENELFRDNLSDFRFCVTRDNHICWTALYDCVGRLETALIPFSYLNKKIVEQESKVLVYENKRHVIYDCEDEGGAMYIPVCPNCGKFVKADKAIKFKCVGLASDSTIPNATCPKCGRVAMPFEGLL